MYLIGKILVSLIVAFVIGLTLGWLLRRSMAVKRERASETAWSQRLRRAQQEHETDLARIKGDVEEYRSQIPTLEQSLADRSDLIARLEDDIRELREGAGPARERIVELERDLAATRDQLTQQHESAGHAAGLEEALAERRKECERLRQELADAAERTSEHTRQLEAMQAQLDAVRQEARQHERRAGDVTNELEELRQKQATAAPGADVDRQRRDTLAKLEASAAHSRQEVAQLQHQAEHWRERCAELERDTQHRGERIETFASQLRDWRSRHAATEAQLHERNQRIEELERELAARPTAGPPRPQWLLDRADIERPDDLKEIRGVGPMLEKTLNELGVWTFGQLARLHDEDVRWLARNIGTFPGRIERDRWIEQARELQTRQEETSV